MGRGDLRDAEWELLRPFLSVSNGRCGRWRDHRLVIDGILHRVRTGVQWRGLPGRFGPWKTVYERHRLWSADGTWERLLRQVQAAADAVGEIDWDISVRAHQHAVGARTGPPPAPASKEGRSGRTPGRHSSRPSCTTRSSRAGHGTPGKSAPGPGGRDRGAEETDGVPREATAGRLRKV
ncbi:IS5 family transposase [Streptomyces sp. MMS20-AI2-20]|uniref:IS5 family transposase n=1 Tax=Streptomyces sp. MMS20-AI2-20 TaxID=2925835 RepID=UPI0035AE293E